MNQHWNNFANQESAYDNIIIELERTRIDYEILSHAPVYTMKDVAEIINIPEAGKVKTLVLQIRTQPTQLVLCGVSASGRLDFKLVAKFLNVSRSSLTMVKPAEVLTRLGIPLGALGLIVLEGNPSVLLSELFENQDYLYFGIGRNDRTIKIDKSNLKQVIEFSFVNIEREK